MSGPKEWLADTWRQVETVATEQRGEVRVSPAGCMALVAERKRLLKVFDDANKLIFAAGAPLGSERYFAIRTLLSDALK